MESNRELIKGPLRPPPRETNALSYTQAPASKDMISVRNGKEKAIKVTEFSSRAVPQPFLDPSIVQRRLQADKQWNIDQARKSKQEQAAASSLRGGAVS
ncbi:hypothetical protein D0Z07_0808 [Hyphodiscus hymeniophilus]|uniref:Uncharacterized protein n=1 Tax=Hyphodiscus hymeniophilus TaxID=353542 RepID=A0A9P6VPK8_9HELO|nr:hypothetical protein D0Z07_0808 [Hyphodiscus hymeniophilus]